MERVAVEGKFFQVGGHKWYVKGLTYGPFAPNSDGLFLPERSQRLRDFIQMRRLGANAIRLYHPPSIGVLDEALAHGLRVLIDVPWEKHRCFFEDWSSEKGAIEAVRTTARQFGSHPAVFAISVANEIPKDIVLFYGAKRVERFLRQLIEVAKEDAPDCLATYTNYPSTEFLSSPGQDFYCANVYLDHADVLGRYLDRLQHVAERLPLVLGEYGLDSYRHGEDSQAESLGRHVEQVFRHGLAGSFVFSYTDEWFTGGHLIENWAFGVTHRNRLEKPAAREISRVWASVPGEMETDWPRVSVVVCSYNGASTLEECLDSLVKLDYPDYEIILVDDGSTDNTREIAARFRQVQYHYQANAGLSAARNVGARLARGAIVAYTDSDCVADDMWLRHLMQAMRNQQVDAIGGPNVVPANDGWIARCVSCSPGGPSHVMLDDCLAEHIPGCNMAFRRDLLLGIGGFDVQFTQAGDDVDVCWRFLDSGLKIGYAPAALVWHHRRSTIKAYCRQQKGYGRSESMLKFKHPHRFNLLGCSLWQGVIYGEGAVGLPLVAPKVRHGKFGSGLFQMIYRTKDYSPWIYFTLLEWYALAALCMCLSFAFRPLAVISGAMFGLSAVSGLRSAWGADLAKDAPWWCLPLIGMLHMIQPVVRSWARYHHHLATQHLPDGFETADSSMARVKLVSWRTCDMYWQSNAGRGREDLLGALVTETAQAGWNGDFDAEWQEHDVELVGDAWHHIRLRTATEELGGPKRFTRVRWSLLPTHAGMVYCFVLICLTIASVLDGPSWPLGISLATWPLFLLVIARSRRRCNRAISGLIWRAGIESHLEPVESMNNEQAEVSPCMA